MTPPEVLGQVEGLGFRLSLRPGGLRLSGAGEPPPQLLALIAEHRPALLALLEADAEAWAAHESSLAESRVTTFPDYLAHLVHPDALRACRDAEAEQGARRRAALGSQKGPRRTPFQPNQTRSNPRRC